MSNTTLDLIHGILYGSGLRFGKLNPFGRVIATAVGKHADRVPFMGPQIHDHAMTVAKVPAKKYYTDAELLVRVHLAVNRWYQFDSHTIIGDSYNFEVEALGAKLIYSNTAMPTVDTSQPLIKSSADLDKLGSMDITKGRIPMALELTKLVIENVPGPLGLGFFCSPFSLICQAMGYPKAVRALRRNKQFAKELFDYVENDVLFPFLKAQREVGAKGAVGADAWTAFPNLTPDLIEEWVLPSAKRMAERGKKELKMNVMAAAGVGDYCEEDPAKFDKEMMFRCWDISNAARAEPIVFSAMGRTQEWNMEWMQEYAHLRGKKGRKLPIYAALNGRFTRDSSPMEIVEKIREWIDIAGRDGGLYVFVGNVPADTSPSKIHAAVQAVHKLGKYPIAENLSSIQAEPPKFKPFDQWLKGQPEEELILKAREWKPRSKVVSA